MQQRLDDKVTENANYYGLSVASSFVNEDGESDGVKVDLDCEVLEADLATGNKDTCVLEVNICFILTRDFII